MKWHEMEIESIVSAINAEGAFLLADFLRDYSKLTGQTDLCASCPHELARYLRDYKLKFNEMSNKSQYKLHAKYEGIQLDFGSSIHVTNANMTDKLGAQLLKNKGKHLFERIPEPKVKTKKEK